ncbi:hypothetical protein FRX31_030587 [Thalictrum thalictroides]|uniref:Uncharacterized protein n=1 Tax=Thalictrum thalictroides TaxID=46969 RepID=A0A7J6V4D5_THATH|nr:hypothetical protein FRX31_030587 [Thalictrum thalictroides]
MSTHGSKVDKEKPNDKEVSKGPLEIGNKGKGIDNNVRLQDNKTSKDVVKKRMVKMRAGKSLRGSIYTKQDGTVWVLHWDYR